MDDWEVEGEAEAIIRHAGLDPRDHVQIVRLARSLGIDVRRTRAAALCDGAELVRVNDEWRIYLRPGLSPVHARFAAAHEMAEWWLKRQRYDDGDIEQVADRLGAAIVAPQSRVVRLVRAVPNIRELADGLRSTESLAALRVGEVTGEPIALVARQVRVRGDEWAWPRESELRRAVRGAAPKGLVKVRISDEPRRVVLRAAAGED